MCKELLRTYINILPFEWMIENFADHPLSVFLFLNNISKRFHAIPADKKSMSENSKLILGKCIEL